MSIDKCRLAHAISACVKNGQRLHQDANWMGEVRAATGVALCILAQEEFAKAFLLHLVCEGIIPWTAKVRSSLCKHSQKQLVGLIMEWLSPSDEEFIARISSGPRDFTLPAHVADAMKLYVENVQPKGHISCPPAASAPIARAVASGHRDKTKQDALYVRLSEDAEIVSLPTQVTPNNFDAEIDKTKRLSDLVRPLQDGGLGPVLDYQLLQEAMRFLFLDKRKRPFLMLKELQFGGPVNFAEGTTWPHSIKSLIQNISAGRATRVNGHAAVFLDKEAVRPSLLFDEFAVDPYAANLCTFTLSEETHACGTSPSHTLNVYVHLDYYGATSARKYHARMWSTYDPTIGLFTTELTDSLESLDGCIRDERTWKTIG